MITARQQSFGKVMFSQVSVILFGGSEYAWSQVPWRGGYIQGVGIPEGGR